MSKKIQTDKKIKREKEKGRTMLILRDYQQEAVEKVMASWQGNPSGRELLVLGTGGGKTIIFSEIIRRVLAESGGVALVLAHRDDLINQAIEKYHMASPDAIVGKVKGSQCELGGQVTVASVASACKLRRLKMMQEFNYSIIVIDEAHHCASASYQKVLEAFPDAFVLLVTATEDRLDGKKIIDKPAIFSMPLEQLIREKHCAPVRAQAIKTDVDLSKLHTSMGDFNEHELSEAVNTPGRNHLIAEKYLEYATGMPFIGFGVTVDHATALAYTFNEMGIASGVVTGKTSDQERQEMYSNVASGTLQGMFSVQVLTEGFDLPCISCIIMARPTQSRSLYVQMVGRGSRLHPGKDHFLVLDITDNCLRHRLTPHNLNKALGLRLKDNETIEEAEEREQREADEEREKEAQIRKLRDKRKADLAVDLLQKFDWKKRESDGVYVLAFGAGHRMALKPEQDQWNPWDVPVYSVWWRHNEDKPQRWSSMNLTLTEALQFAEARVLKIEADPKAIALYDKNAQWLREPPTDAQRQMALWYRIEIEDGMTKGELSELIDRAVEARKARKREKEERKLSQVER